MRTKPEAELILHSVSMEGIQVATFRLRYWRPIHAEFMTHRKFGRNARSSRAVPNKVLLREPIMEPAVYGANIPGMSAGEELKGWRLLLARSTWLALAHITRAGVRLLHVAGLHKQWSNRPLEWFGCIDVLVTATDWQNWFALRDHPAAAPEIRDLARAMRNALRESTPIPLHYGAWHLPYIRTQDRARHDPETLKKLSGARCARISYRPFEGGEDIESELARVGKLLGIPVHASPFEHQCTPDRLLYDKKTPTIPRIGKWEHPELHGNLTGWIQYRKTIPNEAVHG